MINSMCVCAIFVGLELEPATTLKGEGAAYVFPSSLSTSLSPFRCYIALLYMNVSACGSNHVSRQGRNGKKLGV